MTLLCKFWRSHVCSVCKSTLRDWQNKDTLWWQHCWCDHVPQILTCFTTRATFVSDTNFASWTHKMFLKIFRNISCVSTAHNNVAAFCHGRATLQDTMLLPPCFLVLPWEVITQKAHPCSPKLLHSGDFLCWYVGPYFMTGITWALPWDALLLTNPVKAFETNDF